MTATGDQAAEGGRIPALALDIGGTKIAGGLVDPDGQVLVSRVVPTPQSNSADVVFAAVAGLLANLLAGTAPRVTAATGAAADAGAAATGADADAVPAGRGHGRYPDRPAILGVGVGSAGPVDLVHGTVSPVNIGAWRQFPLRGRLAELVPGLPVRLGGDGICAAIAEQWRGAGEQVPAMLGVVVSTGVGGGLILNGRPFPGPTGNAGHVGHIPVDFDGERCRCGGRGCVETIASGPNLVRGALTRGWLPTASVGRTGAGTAGAGTTGAGAGTTGAGTTGTTGAGTIGGVREAGPTARDLAASARAGNPIAMAAFTRAGWALAAGFASVAAICDIDRVVVGGGVAEAGALLFDAIDAGMVEFCGLDFTRRVTVRPARLGQAAGLVGAAALLLRPDPAGLVAALPV